MKKIAILLGIILALFLLFSISRIFLNKFFGAPSEVDGGYTNTDDQTPILENDDGQDIETNYTENKTIRVSDGDVSFYFEIPENWLVETRHSGEKQLTIEEMKEFLATSYRGDIKNDPNLTSDYADLPWNYIEKMNDIEIKENFEKKDPDFPSAFPNASVTADDKIWYTDTNWDQVDFYFKNLPTEKLVGQEKEKDGRYCENRSASFNGCGAKSPTWSQETVNEQKVDVKSYYIDKDEDGNELASKAGTGGKEYFVQTPNTNKTLMIRKQARAGENFEKGFALLIKTLKFE